MSDAIMSAHIFKPFTVDTLLYLLVIMTTAAVLVFFTRRLIPWIANRLHGKRRLVLLAGESVLRLLVILIALMLCIPLVIEPSLQSMVAVFSAVGLAVGFALKDYTSSLVAGVVAVGEMPYRNGDWIEVNGVYGEVRHVGMRTVSIVTPDDTMVSIPHLKIWTELILNANNGGPSLQCATDFFLHPRHDAAQVRQVLEDVALTSPYLQVNKPVVVIVQERPWGTQYRLRAYPVDPRQQFRFITDLTVRGKAALSRLEVYYCTVPATMGLPGSEQ
jgi:small conductance mechanosensitive channel